MNRKVLGYILIIIGIALPLYGFTSMSLSQWSSKSEYENFKKEQEKRPETELKNEGKEAEEYNNKVNQSVTTIVDPFEAEKYDAVYNLSSDKDAIFAYLRIPSLEIERPIYLGASQKHLAMGVAQIDGTSLPIGGIGNRSVIAGHRGFYKDTMFLYLAELKDRDKVYIDRAGKTLEYEVVGREIIKPSEWEKLQAVKDKDLLTLLTCDPFAPPRPNRLLIHCERVAEKIVLKNEDEPKSTEKSALVTASYYSIYAITIIGWFAFIIILIKLIKFMSKRK